MTSPRKKATAAKQSRGRSKRKTFRYLSVCSGIEAASVAWSSLGWQAAGFAEIEAFPSAVLAYRWPEITNFGDFTEIKSTDVGSINLLVGGTPCQSFSVAGLRKGLCDDRGNLAIEYFRLAERCKPAWLLWENVPGVLSSNNGRDFGSILGAMVECGYGFAYRVLNAQYFGVPQRRRRVFLVGYFGDWRPAAAVLFERESLSWNSPPRPKAREDVAGTFGSRTHAGGGFGTDSELDGGPQIMPALTTRTGTGPGSGGMDDYCIAHALAGEGFDASEDGSGRGTPLVPVDTGFQGDKLVTPEMNWPCLNSQGGNNGGGAGAIMVQPIPILEVGKGSASRGQGRNGVGIGKPGDPMFTLLAGSQHAVAFDCKASGQYGFGVGNVAPTLRAMGGQQGYQNAGGQVAVSVFNSVRRLTPRECERLQGFPDDHTGIHYRGKPAADGPRYRAIGNSMAVPVMQWLGERIALVDTLLAKQ